MTRYRVVSPTTVPAAITPPPNRNTTKPFGVPPRPRQGPLALFPATAIDLEDTPASPLSPPPSHSQAVLISPVTREDINAFRFPTKNLQLTSQRNLLDQREVMDVWVGWAEVREGVFHFHMNNIASKES